MTPLFNKIFVRPMQSDEKTASGLSLNASGLKKGEVLFCGAGLPTMPTTVKKGDTVIYPADTGVEFSDYNGAPGIFLREDEITAIL